MSLLTSTRIVEGALGAMVVFVSVRSPRHRIFAAWIWFALFYDVLDQDWIQPVLSHLPRPFTGRARLFLHASQALFVGIRVAFVAVVLDFARVRRAVRPLPWFLGFATVVLLVGGYAHSPGPGLYRALGFTFRSRQVYEILELLCQATILGSTLPQLRTIVDEARSTDDVALLGTVAAIDIAWIFYLGVSLLPITTPNHLVPASLLAAYTIGVGFHVPVIVWHSLGERSRRFMDRQGRARRRESIFEMGRRIEASRAAVEEMLRIGKPMPEFFPTAREVAARGGLMFRLIALALEDLALAGTVECVLAIAISLGDVAGAGMLVRVDETIRQAAAEQDASDDDEFPWLEVFRASNPDTDSYRSAMLMPLYAQLRGLTWKEAMKAIAFARSIATAAALQDPKFRRQSAG